MIFLEPKKENKRNVTRKQEVSVNKAEIANNSLCRYSGSLIFTNN